MTIVTSSGNTYTYKPFDNEIVDGYDEVCTDFSLRFNTLQKVECLPSIDAYTIGVTEQCNSRCSYCCYSGKYPEHRKHSSSHISIAQIPLIIRFIKDTAKSENISIDFYGGESLLELAWIKEFIGSAEKQINKRIQFELSTNGLLLVKSTVDWLVLNEFNIFLSLDGPGYYHDKCRMDSFGNGTYDRIVKNISYIKTAYPQYWENNVKLMMTVPDISVLPQISRDWESDSLLQSKTPYRISEVATIYNSDVAAIDFDAELYKYNAIVEYFKGNPKSKLLGAFFNIWLAEWINRLIFPIMSPVDCTTCLPNNRRLYIDSNGAIGICEQSSDNIRIGNISAGLDFTEVNKTIEATAAVITNRCSDCEISRLCDVCPDILKLSPELVNVYCHNQRVLQRIKFKCFCELAEAELI